MCLDFASKDNSLSAYVLTVTPVTQTGNLILLKLNLRFWRPQKNPQGDLQSSSSAAVLVINNNNNHDNTFPCLQELLHADFSASWLPPGETKIFQFTTEGPCLWKGRVTWVSYTACV